MFVSDFLKVPLAYQRLLQRDRISWESSVQHFVESKILKYLPKEFIHLGELPLTTPSRLDDSQVECRLSGQPAFLRTTFEQVIPEERFRDGESFCASGVIFRKTDSFDNFSSYPGSYKVDKIRKLPKVCAICLRSKMIIYPRKSRQNKWD